MQTFTNTLPKPAARLLFELEARHITIRVQQKLDEAGCWRPELQANGAVFEGDWQRLRRYHEPIVRHLQASGAVDEPFREVVLPKRLPFGEEV